MHAFFLPFGAYPNNAIVGASAGIATGAALHKKLQRKAGIAVAFAGDGSTGSGPVTEAMNFGAMAQYDRQWPEPYKGGPAGALLLHQQFLRRGGQTRGETMGWDRLSRIGAGVNPANLHAETVDGASVLAVADAVDAEARLLTEGKGPALLDVEAYRISGHSTTDANVYRTREEMQAWSPHDPIAVHAAALREAGLLDDASEEALRTEVQDLIRAVTAAAVNPGGGAHHRHRRPADADRRADVFATGAAISAPPTRRWRKRRQPRPMSASSARRAAPPTGPDGAKLSPMRAITVRDALFEAILHHFTHDPSLVAYGEECRGGAAPSASIAASADILPYNRLFNSPISEAAIVATAIGYAIEGGRSLVELDVHRLHRPGRRRDLQPARRVAVDVGGRAEAARRAPLLDRQQVRRPALAGLDRPRRPHPRPQGGLPGDPYDAKGLLAASLASDDPVVFFESQRLYDTTELFHSDGVPTEYYRVPIGVPDVKREGSDVTILTVGPSLYAAVAAAVELERERGLSAEIIDARSLVPFDYAPVRQSVKKTGRILLVSEASERGSFLQTLAANIGRSPSATSRRRRACSARPTGSCRARRWNRPISRRPTTSSTSSSPSCSANRATIAAGCATGTTESLRASVSDRGAPGGAKLHYV